MRERESQNDGQSANRAAVMQTLEAGVESVMTQQGFQDYLKAVAKFHQYSFQNTILIMQQNPEATRVAGFRKWQELGRQVRKGERGIQIFVPHKKTVEDEETGEKSVYLTGFGIGYVFDVSQTEGEPLPERPRPTLLSSTYSPAGDELTTKLSLALLDQGLRLKRGELLSANGTYNGQAGEIVLAAKLEGDQNAKTLAHEASHHFARHGVEGYAPIEDRETVAESTAFVVLHHFGIDSGEYSFPYIATWSKNPEVLQRNLGEIQQISTTIIQAVEGIDPIQREELTGGSPAAIPGIL